jgi:hypothetical protein
MKFSQRTLTPRKRVESALRHGYVDKIPFTIYEDMLPQCEVERQLRNRGLCIVNRRNVFTTHYPNVKIWQEVFTESGKKMTRTYYQTPVGTLTTLSESAGFTSWYHEKMFKTPDDYKALLFLIKDEVYEPDYEAFSMSEKQFGEDGIFRASFGRQPLQALISGMFMKMETFCFEWMERRDEILKLYNALVEKRREVYTLVANSPASYANYGGNIVPEIIGLETFQKYYVPHYNEAAEIMHKHGKLIGSHFDGNCKLISKAIGDTDLDYIEAFTPAPDTDMTLSEAREAWPDKVLWLNFPSSVHLKSPPEIEKTTVELLNEVQRIDGIIIGITEDMPEGRWQQNCVAIMDGIERHAVENPGLYA